MTRLNICDNHLDLSTVTIAISIIYIILLSKAERFRAIHEAWKILGDQESRSQYDKEKKEKQLAVDSIVADDVDFAEFEETEVDESTRDVLYTKSCRCGDQYMVRLQLTV